MGLQRAAIYTHRYDHIEETMMKREAGFSLIELLITMVIMGFVLTLGSDMFVGLLRGYKQQSKITETNIEGIVALELLRRDIASAGYGLPWSLSTAYNEATNAVAAVYNDSPTNSPPRAIVSGDNITAAGYVNGSDYLVIKAVNLAQNDTCTKWTILPNTGIASSWTPTSENLATTDRVILISPGSTAANSRTLVASGIFSAMTALSSDETSVIYGVAPADANPLWMPFNRADYYVKTTGITIPGRCASGTGVLYKAIVDQSGGGFSGNVFPLFDCIADMQVSYDLDRNGDGTISNTVVLNDLLGTPLTAQQLRDQLKVVRVYILAHEGQRDDNYTNPTNPILVGQSAPLGRNFDLSSLADPKWQHYRWKVYSLIVRPNNLR